MAFEVMEATSLVPAQASEPVVPQVSTAVPQTVPAVGSSVAAASIPPMVAVPSVVAAPSVTAAPSVVATSIPSVAAAPVAPVSSVPPAVRRPLPPGTIRALLRSAVSLQAEGLLRTAGALAGAWGGVLDRTEWIERDARDLSVLAAAAVAAQVPLPAGVDTGAGDPGHPGSVVESLLAGHEALVRVLRELADAADEPRDAPLPLEVAQNAGGPGSSTGSGPGTGTGSGPGTGSGTGAGVAVDAGHEMIDAAAADGWRAAVRRMLCRREEEILLLRAVGATGTLPADERYLRGRPPRP